MAAASSTSHLNPMAPPFSSCAFADWQLYADAQMPGCFTSPACGVAVACSCSWCVSGFLSGGAGTYCAVGVAALPPPAWVPVQYLPPPPPPVTVVCSPPPLPPPAFRCIITEIVDEGSAVTEGDDEPSPRSVLTSWKRPKKPTAVLPPKRPAVKLLERRAAHPPSPPSPAYGDKASFDPTSNKTSLMICNIPNSFSKRRLMAILDQHCAEENDMLLRLQRGGGGCAVVKSEYDFLYVPIDFRTMFNKGYAFVNMTSATAALRLHAFLHGHRWGAVGSRKVCQVVHARFEGVDAFVEHFAATYFPCRDKELLPVRFGPARDGSRRTAERVVGHLQNRRLR